MVSLNTDGKYHLQDQLEDGVDVVFMLHDIIWMSLTCTNQ